MSKSVQAVVPTRDRPAKLAQCLAALTAARELIEFSILVCDSSTTSATRMEVASVCAQCNDVRLIFHQGDNVAKARNTCVWNATADLLVNVDDDIYVQPDAIKLLVEAYLKNDTPYCVVGGAVAWGGNFSQPVVMRLIGYGRASRQGEEADFLVGALLLYPRSLALALPWNERVRTSDDRFIGAVWRSRHIKILFEPAAEAFHDEQHNRYSVACQADHIYANLFDAILVKRSLKHFLGFQFLGFAAGAKLYFKKPESAFHFVYYWLLGNAWVARDWTYLRSIVRTELPLL